MKKPTLHGLRILVTRPEEQAQRLAQSIQDYGGEVVVFPLLETRIQDQAPASLANLQNYHMIIFVSRSAAKYIWPFLPHGLPDNIKIAVVGSGTRQELIRHGRHPDLMPLNRFDTEGLLELEDLEEVEDEHILIVRGQDGREKLREALTERGAKVSYAEVYQRHFSQQALTNNELDVDAIVITSGQALEHLVALAKQAKLEEKLFRKTLVLIHSRIASNAKQLGFENPPLVAKQASDQGILKALLSITS